MCCHGNRVYSLSTDEPVTENNGDVRMIQRSGPDAGESRGP